METRSPQSHLQSLCVPTLRQGGRHLCVPTLRRGGRHQRIRFPPPSVRAERKARVDKLQSLLYPHPDKLADFKSSVGGDLQPHHLFSDVKFRYTWMQFKKNPKGSFARGCIRWR